MNGRSLAFGIPIFLLVFASVALSSHIQNTETLLSSGFTNIGCASGYDYCKIGEYYNLSVKDNPTSNDPILLTKNGLYLTLKPSEIFYADLNNEQEISTIQSVQGSLKNYGNNANDIIHYPNAFGNGISLEYTWTKNRLLKFLIINDFTDLPRLNTTILDVSDVNLIFRETFTFSPNLDVYIDSKKWDKNKKETTDKEIKLKNGNETVMILPAPYMKDADGNYKKISYILRKKDGKLKIAIAVPYDWLYAAKYPIMIDPIIQTNVATPDATSFGNQRHIVRTSNGQIHVVYTNLATGAAEYSNSTDFGATWNGNQIIFPTCIYPSIDVIEVITPDDLLVVCENDDSYTLTPPYTMTWVSTTGGAPPAFNLRPDLDVGNVTGIAAVAEEIGGTVQYWESIFPYLVWTPIFPQGGLAASANSIDIAIDFTETYVCIGYENSPLWTYEVTCCNIAGGMCAVNPFAWFVPVVLGASDFAVGSCAFDEQGNFTCAYVDTFAVGTPQISISTLDLVSRTVTETTVLDPQPKMTCNYPSLSIYNSTEQYVTMECDDGTRGGLTDIFVANRSTAKHWGYPQKESTNITWFDDILKYPASPQFFDPINLPSNNRFEWIYTIDQPFIASVDVYFDNATWSPPTTNFCGGSYTGGDWIIGVPTMCADEVIHLDNASSLIINDDLVFDNITLKVNGFQDSENVIVINGAPAAFNVIDSTIEQGYCPQCYYTFNAEDTSIFDVSNSDITYAGASDSHAGAYRNTGIWINTSNVIFDNVTVTSKAGISFYGSATYGTSGHLINRTVIVATGSNDAVYTINISSSTFDLSTITTAAVAVDGIQLGTYSSNNNILNSDIEGIFLDSATYNLVQNTSSHGGGANIVLTSSDYNTITNNTAYNAALFHGINLQTGSDYNNIKDNIIFGNPNDGIILQTNNDWNNITNNTVYSNTNGIMLNADEDNNRIENNTVYNTGLLKIGGNSNNNIVSNNTVYGSSYIGVTSSDNNYINGNYFPSNPLYAIYVSASNDIIVSNNTLLATNRSIFIQNSDRIFLWNNTINVTAVSRSGITLENSDYVNVTNNTISFVTIEAISLLAGSSDLNIINNTIDNSLRGIVIPAGSNNNNISGNLLINNINEGLHITGGNGNLFFENTMTTNRIGVNITNVPMVLHQFANSTISGSTDYDVILSGLINVTFMNVTFRKMNLSNTNANLTVNWYADVKTVHADFSAFPNANVSYYNVSDHQLYNGLSDAFGYIPRQIITDYKNFNGVYNNWNTYKFDGSSAGVMPCTACYYGTTYSDVVTNNVTSVIIIMNYYPSYFIPLTENKTLRDVWCAVLGFADCDSVPYKDYRQEQILGVTWDRFILNNLWWIAPLVIGLIIIIALYIRGKRREDLYEEPE